MPIGQKRDNTFWLRTSVFFVTDVTSFLHVEYKWLVFRSILILFSFIERLAPKRVDQGPAEGFPNVKGCGPCTSNRKKT